MKKSLTLVTGSIETKLALEAQLKDYLPSNIKINCVSTESDSFDIITDSLVIFSSSVVKDEMVALGKIDLKVNTVIAKRTISYDKIDQVVLLPQNTSVLLVNDAKESALESIEMLKFVGLDYLNYVPCYPGVEGDFLNIKIAITPGELGHVPNHIADVIDIGSRIMDFSTIAEILNKLNILNETAGRLSQKYLMKIINMSKNLAKSANEIKSLNEDLSIVLDRWNDGILVFDKDNQIIVFNENLRTLLGVSTLALIDKDLKRVITSPLLKTFLLSDIKNHEEIIKINGEDILVNKHYLSSNQTTVVGFKNLKATIDESDRLKRDLIKKGHYAKYFFSDFIGTSLPMKNLKIISKKIAKSELTVLIEGESGTGKEMLASAIHNGSPRMNGPFLAVNFSAFPDELIESEIFGYEEGAFTGAKKGGKIGLFEQANKGTIFLDEIGDISLKMQAKLLRVLQEKEIMRIGGTHIKTVDVRIIAATNKNLEKMVSENKFREDLYYRLKLGYLNTVPLRDRKEDIPDLVIHMINTESNGDISVSDEVISTLLKHDWHGNVRELKNTVLYMLAVKEGNHLAISDLPNMNFFNKPDSSSYDCVVDPYATQPISDELAFILTIIHELSKNELVVGRENLCEATKNTPYEMTVAQMRNRLEKLERLGFIDRKKGKHGTKLNQNGIRFLAL